VPSKQQSPNSKISSAKGRDDGGKGGKVKSVVLKMEEEYGEENAMDPIEEEIIELNYKNNYFY
jgi:hypothetical protein